MGYGNSGYVGFSRSIRSREAISLNEVPMNHINKGLLLEVYDEVENIKSIIVNAPVSFIKHVVSSSIPSSWHHTGKFFNETDHYDLTAIIEELNELSEDEILEQMNAFKAFTKENKKQPKESIKTYVIIEETTWEGSRKHPKKVVSKYCGIKVDDTVFVKSYSGLRKLKSTANKNTVLEEKTNLRGKTFTTEQKENLKSIEKMLKGKK